MAKKKRRKKKKARRANPFAGKHGKKAAKKKKIGAVTLSKNLNVWDVEKTLRKDNYFARAVGPHKIVTNAPIK